MVEYAKTVSKTKFNNNCSEEFFAEFYYIVKKYEGKEEVFHCLMSILSLILYRGIRADLFSYNQYDDRITKSGVKTEITVNVKKIVEERKKDGKKMDERKEEIVFTYSWLMKYQKIEPSLLLSLTNIVVGIMERSVKEKKKGEIEMKASLALQCIVEYPSLLFF
jgi:hypothetical protein